MYRETNDSKYLEQVKHITGFILNHPNLPADQIPYWDFNDPDIPNTLRDASAGAIIASALIELSENGNFILKHSVGYLGRNIEVDAPLTYADYYYIESLLHYYDMLNKK